MNSTAASSGPGTLANLAEIVRTDVWPQVKAIDAGAYPEAVLRRLGSAGAFEQHVDGTAAGVLRAVDAMSEVATACLSTAFCTWCQDALVWCLARSAEPRVSNELAAVASGARLGGTGLSNAMKAVSGIEPLALSGTRVSGGYQVRGRLPWVSNIAPGHRFVALFALEDGTRVMALFTAGAETVELSADVRFVALEGTGTYTVTVRDAFVPDADVVAPDAAAFVPRIRNGFILLQTGMGLGLARGAAAQMRADDRGRRQASALPLGPEAVEERAETLRRKVAAMAERQEDPSRGTFLDVLRLRLDVSFLALEAAQAAMLQSGARGYQEGSEAFRRLREAQFIAIVTPSAKHISAELAKGA